MITIELSFLLIDGSDESISLPSKPVLLFKLTCLLNMCVHD